MIRTHRFVAIEIISLKEKVTIKDRKQTVTFSLIICLLSTEHGQIITNSCPGQVMGQGFFASAFGMGNAPGFIFLNRTQNICRKKRFRIFTKRYCHNAIILIVI